MFIFVALLFLSTMKIERDVKNIDNIGDDHIGTSANTPMRDDAFKLSNEEKIDIIKDDVRHIMETLGLDLTDDSLNGTPMRVAKMFVNEVFGGLNPKKKPRLLLLKININMVKCWLKKTLQFIQHVNIIYYQLLEKHM